MVLPIMVNFCDSLPPTPPLHFMVHSSLTLMQRRNVTSTSVRHHHDVMCLLGTYSLSPNVEEGGSSYDLPPSVCASVRHSIHLSVRQFFSRNSSYIFHRTDLKFYGLLSYHMKMCMWFLILFRPFLTKLS